MSGDTARLTLRIVTPTGARDPIACDSVHLTVCDDGQGKGGGSYGIRPGHTKALLALDAGPIRAFLAGEPVLSGQTGGGFATVDGGAVTAVVESFNEVL